LTIFPAAWAAGTTPCSEFVAPAGAPAPEMLVRFRYVSCTRRPAHDVQPPEIPSPTSACGAAS
jgi:hypothetical protein